MKGDLSLELLEYVHRFYPIGMPYLYAHPRNKLERDIILENKINEIIDLKTTDWSLLVKTLQDQELSVSDLGFRQFPSYYLEIACESPDGTNKIHGTRSLVLVISLLCPFYTVFYKDVYKFDEFKSPIDKTVPRFTIIFTQTFTEEAKLQESLNNVKGEVERYFPQKSFIPHNRLFNHLIQAGDLKLEGNSQTGSLPVFLFLFEDSIDLQNLEVRK